MSNNFMIRTFKDDNRIHIVLDNCTPEDEKKIPELISKIYENHFNVNEMKSVPYIDKPTEVIEPNISEKETDDISEMISEEVYKEEKQIASEENNIVPEETTSIEKIIDAINSYKKNSFVLTINDKKISSISLKLSDYISFMEEIKRGNKPFSSSEPDNIILLYVIAGNKLLKDIRKEKNILINSEILTMLKLMGYSENVQYSDLKIEQNRVLPLKIIG